MNWDPEVNKEEKRQEPAEYPAFLSLCPEDGQDIANHLTFLPPQLEPLSLPHLTLHDRIYFPTETQSNPPPFLKLLLTGTWLSNTQTLFHFILFKTQETTATITHLNPKLREVTGPVMCHMPGLGLHAGLLFMLCIYAKVLLSP